MKQTFKERLFSPTPKRIKRFLLAFKGFIGTVSLVALIQESPYLSAGFLITGAFIDFIVDFIYTDDESEAI